MNRIERIASFVLLLHGLANSAHAAPDGDATRGQAAFTVCAACHQVGPDARNGFGPPLHGIVGRVAGSRADYDYSPAMKRSGIVWSVPTISAFIRDPDRVVPGTKMRFSGFGYSESRIADLAAYLASLRAPVAGSVAPVRPALAAEGHPGSLSSPARAAASVPVPRR